MQTELYENLGFHKNPFSTFSAEEEVDFINNIFVSPLYLKSLKDEISSGHSRFVLGARGVGKTSLIYSLRSFCQGKRIFSVIVDDFEGVPISKNKSALLKLIIETILRDYSIYLAKNPEFIKKIDNEGKEKLAFLIKGFFKTISKTEFENHYNRVTKYKAKNFIKHVYNKVFNKPINLLISGGIEIVSDTVRNSLGLPDPNSGKFYKSYIPELDIENPDKDKSQNKLYEDEKTLKNILVDISKIINQSGLGRPVIFFDKIDEYPKLSSNISNVSSFIEEFLKDTSLLLNREYSLVFSIWDALKPDLTSKGVRFDKIKPLDITWSKEQLRAILKKRLDYFSGKSIGYEKLLQKTDDIEGIIELSSNSPRYLFRLFSVIYDQQNNMDSTLSYLSSNSVGKGMLHFSKTFDFYAVFPGKRGTKDDVLTSVNRLLKIGKSKVTTKDFIAQYKVSTPTAINYIKIQQDYGLIVRTEALDGNAPIYEINNPVIKHLINIGVTDIAA